MDIQGVENVAIDKRAPREQYVSSNCRDKGQSWGARASVVACHDDERPIPKHRSKTASMLPRKQRLGKKDQCSSRNCAPRWVFWLAKTTTTATIPLHSKQASAPWTSKPQAGRRGNEKGAWWRSSTSFLLFTNETCPMENVRSGFRASNEECPWSALR